MSPYLWLLHRYFKGDGFENTKQMVKQRSVSMLIKAPPLKYWNVDLTDHHSHTHCLYINIIMILAMKYAYVSSETKANSFSQWTCNYLHCTIVASSVPVLQDRKEPTGSESKVESSEGRTKQQNAEVALCSCKESAGIRRPVVLMGIQCTPVCMLREQSWWHG